MKIAFPLSAALLTGWLVSCTPQSTEEPPPTPPTDVAENRRTQPDTNTDGAEAQADRAADTTNELKSQPTEERQEISTSVEDPTPAAASAKPSIPVARRVPGREGFVFSPYNNKMINVKDFASGTMVADPTYPPAEKKYFRVP